LFDSCAHREANKKSVAPIEYFFISGMSLEFFPLSILSNN